MTTTVLLAGGGPLAMAIARRLRSEGVAVESLPASAADAEPVSAQRLASASVLLLVGDSDFANVDQALQTRRLQPQLPMVVRVFDAELASYLSDTLPGVTVLSMSRVAAPVFAEAAQKILALPPSSAERRPDIHPTPRRRFKADPILLGALFSLFIVVFPSAAVFAQALNLRYLDGLYFVWTTVMTVGYGDISLKDATDGIKLFGMALMLGGAAFIAVLFALLSDWVLSRRLDMLRGRTRERDRGHVLIVGAGNVGLRVAELLAGSGRRMVFVEQDAANRNAARLAAAGHHVILADATSDETLDLAGLGRAAVVLAVTDTDAVNLKVALHARAHGTPAIVRLLSPELSAHVTERGDGMALSPVAAAAEAFAQAALAAAMRSG